MIINARNLCKTILEYSLNLVTPQFNHLFFGVVEVFVSFEKSLEDLGDVSHVELIMHKTWSREELLLYHVKNVNGCSRELVVKYFNVFVETVEFKFADHFIDSSHHSLSWECKVKHVEVRNDSRRDVSSTTTGFSH
jgi:hypothetical protein